MRKGLKGIKPSSWRGERGRQKNPGNKAYILSLSCHDMDQRSICKNRGKILKRFFDNGGVKKDYTSSGRPRRGGWKMSAAWKKEQIITS